MSIQSISAKLTESGIKHVVVTATKVTMPETVKAAFELYQTELKHVLTRLCELEPRYKEYPQSISYDFLDKDKYIVFRNDRGQSAYLDKATGTVYRGKSGPAVDLKWPIGNIQAGPKTRFKIMQEHFYPVRANHELKYEG